MACPGAGSAANSDKVTSSRGALVPGPPARPSGGPEVRGVRKASVLLEIWPVWVYRMAFPVAREVHLRSRKVKIGDLEAIL